jgi:hypothetical protein
MSEIYPSVRLAIRDSVTRILFDRPGQWLTTAELLNHCEEAETSDALAKILSDMAKTGRLMRGLKTLNAQGREVNTWGLSPKLRDKIMAGQLLAQSHDASHDTPSNAQQDNINQDLAEALLALDAALEECAPHVAVERQTTLASLTPPVASLGTEPQPLPLESYEDEAARLPASVAPPDPAPAFTLWEDASAAVADALTTPSVQETQILCAHLPERWLPELRLRLLGYDGGADPEIILRIVTEGNGAYLTLSTHGKIAFDPGELDFLPSIGNALCQFVDALYPYGTRPTVAATTNGPVEMVESISTEKGKP